MTKSRVLALAVVLGALLAPLAVAVPQVLPASSATVFVDGLTDYFEFAEGQVGTIGASWTITSPDGQSATVTQTSQDPTGPSIIFKLDGTLVSGSGWTWNGNLNEAAADGSWVISRGGSIFASSDNGGASGSPGPTLSVSGKSIHWGIGFLVPDTYNQLWNWHQTTGTWNEPSTVPNAPMMNGQDPVNEGAQEDPNNARFFQDSGVSSFTAYTLNYGTPTDCAGTPDMTVNGAWIGATGTTFSRFLYRDGDFTGTQDLRAIPFSESTNSENEGSTGSGTDSKTITYNNVAGTSYQFLATDTTGEALGAVIYAPSGLCGVPAFNTASDVEHNTDALQVTVSHSQCRDDPVTFAVIMQDNPSGLQEHLLQLFILDANQGGLGSPPDPVEVLYFETGTMHRTAASSEAHSHYVAEVLAPGNYVAYAYVDYTGIGAVDYVSADAFSVPSGSCSDLAADLTPVLTAIESSRVNLTDYLDVIHDHLHGIDGNLNFTRGQILDAIEAINITITGNFTVNNETLNLILEQLMHETAFTTLTGMTGTEFAALLFLSLAGIIIWLRSTDTGVRFFGAVIPVLAGLIIIFLTLQVGVGSLWQGSLGLGAILFVIGCYLIVRLFLDDFQEKRAKGEA